MSSGDHEAAQPGSAKWSKDDLTVQVHRTKAQDASRALIRDARIALPPRSHPLVHEFAEHVSCEAKVLEEDEETG